MSSPSVARSYLKYLAYFIFTSLLLGCSGGATIVSLQNDQAFPAYKLTSARVVWLENKSFQIEITKSGRGAIQVEEKEKIEGRQVIEHLLSQFRNSVVKQVKDQLAHDGIEEGDEVTLEIGAEKGSVGFDNNLIGALGRNLTVRASLRMKGSGKVVWMTRIVAYGPNTEGDQVKVDNFVAELMTALKNAKWIG